jgi:hypothetical protein
MQDALAFLMPDGPTAALAALVAIVWRHVAGQKANHYAARVKEIARAAFALAATVADRTPEQLVDVAKIRAQAMLERLNIPLGGDIVVLLAHELDLLAAAEHERKRDLANVWKSASKNLDVMGIASSGMKAEWDRLERDAAGKSVLDGMDVTIICTEPGCQRTKGHLGGHGEAFDVAGEFETQTPAVR